MNENKRWEDIDKLIARESLMAEKGFEPDNPEEDNLTIRQLISEEMRILVIGAGGLGCELLKDLALLGFRNIDVIDMDTIDVSNLNRQFLFTPDDVGRPKAEVAAEFINKRVPGVKVTPHYAKIQDKDIDFYADFAIIVAGLDSIVARRWINCTLVNMVERIGGTDDAPEWDQETQIPLVDGGSEGFKGQARVIIPRLTPCFECLLELFPKDPLNFPMCTIATTPRQPEHCIQYALIILWEKDRPDEKPDGDNPDHIQWIFDKSVERAKEFGINGVTYRLTQGVVKRIIPAIASTNAIISSGCANEVFKVATQASHRLKNYMMYSGIEGLYTSTFNYDKNPDCSVCGSSLRSLTLGENVKVEGFLTELMQDPKLQLTKPSLQTVTNNVSTTIYMQGILEAQTRPNLGKELIEFIKSGDYINVTDPGLPGIGIQVQVFFTKVEK
jgi:ubiquitin-activating enzyme E1 C